MCPCIGLRVDIPPPLPLINPKSVPAQFSGPDRFQLGGVSTHPATVTKSVSMLQGVDVTVNE
eukprot:3893895-Pyramimonas_sp.AAC.1